MVRTEKEMAQSRRSFLRLGALGAAAVVAAGVLPTGQARAETSTRSAKTVRSSGTIGEATGGKTTRSARKMRSMGEIGEKAEGGGSTRSARSMQKQRSHEVGEERQQQPLDVDPEDGRAVCPAQHEGNEADEVLTLRTAGRHFIHTCFDAGGP